VFSLRGHAAQAEVSPLSIGERELHHSIRKRLLQIQPVTRAESMTALDSPVPNDCVPRISVIVPWIGRPEYIAATVTALQRQDYANLEILISDNSLSTPVAGLLHDAADPRIRIIDRSERRLSSADHFTACLRDASGEFAMILSDDDLIEPRYVSGMLQAIRSHPASTAILGEQIVIGKDHVLEPDDSGEHVVRHYDGTSFFLRRLLNPRNLPIVTYVSLFARRAEMLRFPYRDYPDGSNADNFMMLCLALNGDVTLSSRKMYYRVYESSSGLKTPFDELLNSCSRFERDVAVIVKNRGRLASRFMFRFLVRIRNGSMMTRRLFSLYRHRMATRELFASIGRVALYLAGIGQAAESETKRP
jgi:glycosyltransferase involved in cell wall biosynthesis